MRAFAAGDFEQFTGHGADKIDPRIISRHRQELRTAQRRLRRFVNQHVAHRNRIQMRRLPTYAELYDCVDLLERFAREYTFLIETRGLADVVPVIQCDWRAPFSVPWL
jgi:hypothetical protein